MMITDAHWDLGLKAIAALATTIVAGYVARISRPQWLTNREKLRLDLYDRRFKIYVRVLDFYNAVILWDGSDEQQVLKAPYTQAFRESRFLFPKNSGIFSFLEEFSKRAFFIVNFDQLKEMKSVDPQEFAKQAQKKIDSVNWILESMTTFEDKLEPYLKFHKL
jgi:hypothetical protein